MRDWLKEKREILDFTHEEVANAAEIKRPYYTMIENGYRNPSVDVAKKIAEKLGFNWTLFFEN